MTFDDPNLVANAGLLLVATLVRRLAVVGANVELRAGRKRRAAAEARFAVMDSGGFDLDLDAIDRLNSPPSSG